MNNTDIEYYIQTSRIRSLRRRKRMQYEDFDKKLIKLYKEERAINKQIRSLGYEELNPPIQRGWKRIFVLRAHVAKGKDALFFQNLLDKINTTEYSWRKDFKKKKWLHGKKVLAVRSQELERHYTCAFEKKEFSVVEKKYLDLILAHNQYSMRPEWIYVFNEPWRFTLKTLPNIITKTKIKDFDLEKRLHEIDYYLERNNLRPRLYKIRGGRYNWYYAWYEQLKYKSPFKNKSFCKILEEHWQEQLTVQLNKTLGEPGGFVFYSTILSFLNGIRRACLKARAHNLSLEFLTRKQYSILHKKAIFKRRWLLYKYL